MAFKRRLSQIECISDTNCLFLVDQLLTYQFSDLRAAQRQRGVLPENACFCQTACCQAAPLFLDLSQTLGRRQLPERLAPTSDVGGFVSTDEIKHLSDDFIPRAQDCCASTYSRRMVLNSPKMLSRAKARSGGIGARTLMPMMEHGSANGSGSNGFQPRSGIYRARPWRPAP